MSSPFEIDFTVTAFTKAELHLEVARFEYVNYQHFGFEWFALEQSVIYRHCFFGDLCVKDPDLYTGSSYANQSTGLQLDMPAIAQIKVYQKRSDWNDFQLTGTFTNEHEDFNWGVGSPLCIMYEDYTLYEESVILIHLLYFLISQFTIQVQLPGTYHRFS